MVTVDKDTSGDTCLYDANGNIIYKSNFPVNFSGLISEVKKQKNEINGVCASNECVKDVKLVSTNIGGCYFDEVNFSNIIFSGSKITTSAFTRSEFYMCDFSGAIDINNTYSYCTFKLCDFSGATFDTSRFLNCVFVNCSFRDCEFTFVFGSYNILHSTTMSEETTFHKCGFENTVYLDKSVKSESI